MPHPTKHDDSIHHADGVDLAAADTKSNLFGEGGATVVLEGPTRGKAEVVTRNLTDCPECGSKLSDPVNIGWCLRCGYCRYLEEEAQKYDTSELGLDPETQFCLDVLRALAKRLHGVKSSDRELMRSIDLVLALGQQVHRKRGRVHDARKYYDLLLELEKKLRAEAESGELIPITGYFELLKGIAMRFKRDLDEQVPRGFFAELNIPLPWLSRVPDWLAILVGGLLLFGLGSLMCGSNLRGAPQVRLVWCSIQAALGLTMILAGHSWAFLMVVPARLRRGQWNLAIRPTLLWWAAWHRLPATRWPFWLATWALCLVGGAGLIMLM